MDFFTVPTITFGVLYCFFIIGHDRRRIVNFNVTSHPTAGWIIQQLREAFPYQSAPRFLIFDRDAKYGLEVPIAVRSMAIRPVRTSFQSPWQNGIAERWVESCRRDLLDHVIAFNERHLKRLLSDYVRYYKCVSYYPPRYVVGKPSALCSEAGIAGFRLLPRTRARNWAAASVSIARRLKIQGPSSKGCSASISPRSTASRSVLALTPNVWAASVRFIHPSASHLSAS